MQVFWFEAQAWDRVAGAAVRVRACSASISALVMIDVANGEFLPVLEDGPTFSTSVFDGSFTGRVASTSGVANFITGSGDVDYWATLAWPGRSVKIWTYEVSQVAAWPTFAALTLIFDGTAVDFKPGLEHASLNLAVTIPSGRVASGTYAGTGNQEGRVELTGAVKPYALGTLLNRPARLLDSAKGLYQLHGYGAIDSVAKYREGYRELNQTRVAEASRAALIAATVPATEIHTYLAEGLFRIGFQPLSDITCDFNGSNTGGFSARPGAIMKRMLLDSGWAGGVDTASLTGIDTALPHDAWFYDDQGMDIADALDEFTGRIGGYWDVTRLGSFYVGLVKRQAVTATIGMSGQMKDLDLLDLDALATRAPFHRNRVGYGYNPRTFSAAELAFAAGERGDYAGGTYYSLDNIVTNQGARWQYINATVSSGNAPPVLPTTSNAYWTLLTLPPDYAVIAGTKPPSNADHTISQPVVSQLDTTTGVIKDSRALNANNNFGLRSLIDAPTITDSVVSTLCYINIAAFNVYPDWGGTIAYPSGTIGPVSYATTYFIYRNVASAGSTGTSYGYSTALSDALGVGRVYFGYILTRATSGSGGTTGGGTGGGGTEFCVAPHAWVGTPKGVARAQHVLPDDVLIVLSDDRAGLATASVEANVAGHNFACTITTASGASLTLSVNTPVPSRAGGYVMAANAWMIDVPVLRGDVLTWESVVSVVALGLQPVQQISCHQHVYAAGDNPDALILTHNVYHKP